MGASRYSAGSWERNRSDSYAVWQWFFWNQKSRSTVRRSHEYGRAPRRRQQRADIVSSA
jgi:hypothetical protein